jgi:hypothetical protein
MAASSPRAISAPALQPECAAIVVRVLIHAAACVAARHEWREAPILKSRKTNRPEYPGCTAMMSKKSPMKTRIAAVVTALVLGVAPISSAVASDGARWTGFAAPDVQTTGSLGLGVHDAPFYDRCPMSSAAEGNADQQTRPVKQYGQTTGGYRC